MPTLGEQADVLRALGRFLDDAHAGPVTVTNHAVSVTASWSREDGAAYRTYDPGLLRAEARAMRRGAPGGHGSSPRPELLRTLGQELDRGGIRLIQLEEQSDGFFVLGSADGQPVDRRYPTSELAELSALRRTLRGRSIPLPPA
jgi:hypothetical protein